ncbi:cell fate (sporulation/competence/biofilm development) regulator YmcA (YheA/YmcA/DUF963 family) [Rhizobium skierniewicense]|uniref:Cell fate (Sporulation/competence/biofilm development) regulator YmcA (YheA/YmcA/DUF963 family) n=1 Tax=Rhizobium skierniewicense TaxID=984260 RepID=A0A7W6CJS7_9HYPH|nr:hypothetical protein [Rhizobium skierniewicense]MBB3948391.1 cell fate (sporulation/competence/biofilm development) regulator YmcA (YheA/YmcA/DUF963 family) [Rhizobium skierniewicense]
MNETMKEKAERLRKYAQEKKPEIEARAKALHDRITSLKQREHFRQVEARLTEKLSTR